MTERQEAETTIVELYGCPGEDHDSRDGQDLLLALIEEMGLKALSDVAVSRLAKMHKAMDNRRAPS